MSQPSADLQERARTMRAVGSEGWLPSDDDHAIAAFRQVLCEAGYSGEAIRETLGIAAAVSFNRSDVPIYLRRFPEEGRPSTLIKLFLLGAEVDGTAGSEPRSCAARDCRALGLVECSGTGVKATFSVIPYDGLFLCYDRNEDLQVGMPTT